MGTVFQMSGAADSAYGDGDGRDVHTPGIGLPAPDLPPTCESCLRRLARVHVKLPAIPRLGLPETIYDLCGGCALVYVTEVEA
jgi:hypothetical protein